jgi:hypothetical protein
MSRFSVKWIGIELFPMIAGAASVGGEKAGGLLGIVVPPVVKLGGGRVAMPGRLLHILKLRAVFERCSDKGRAHRMRRVAAIKADPGGVFPHHAVDSVGVHAPGRLERLLVAPQRPEQRRVVLLTVAGALKVGANALCGLRVDSEGLAPAAFALGSDEGRRH